MYAPPQCSNTGKLLKTALNHLPDWGHLFNMNILWDEFSVCSYNHFSSISSTELLKYGRNKNVLVREFKGFWLTSCRYQILVSVAMIPQPKPLPASPPKYTPPIVQSISRLSGCRDTQVTMSKVSYSRPPAASAHSQL